MYRIDYEYDADGRETSYTEWFGWDGQYPYCHIIYKESADPYTGKNYIREKALYNKEGSRFADNDSVWKTVEPRRYDTETGV